MLWFLLLAAIPLLGAGWQFLGSRSDRRRFPPPGRLAGDIHVLEMGAGEPCVVFESGLASTHLSWSLVQPEVARFARTLSYDRAGLGWSRPGRHECSPSLLTGDLRQVLASSGIEGPVIIVAHSFGALIAAGFARKNPSLVAGIVLVDPIRPEEWAPLSDVDRERLRRGVQLSRRGRLLAQLGVVRLCLTLATGGSRWVPKLTAKLAGGGAGSSTVMRLVGEIVKLPPEVWPVVAMHWRKPECFATLGRYLDALPAAAAEAAADTTPVPAPVMVLRAAGSPPLRISARSVEQREAASTGHWIQLDDPELVITAIRELVNRQRAGASTIA